MTYRKINPKSFINMNDDELELYNDHIYWNKCKCSQLGCLCCQAQTIRKLLNRNFSRCYSCICCRDTFPFLIENFKRFPKWRYYQKFGLYDIYECVEDQEKFFLVCDYICDTKIPVDTVIYTEKEICDMSNQIIDKNGHTYLARSEKNKVYNLMIRI